MTTRSLMLPFIQRYSPRQVAWIAALGLPAVLAPAWAAAWSVLPFGHESVIRTASGFVLLAALAAASYTDCRWQLIPNWVTYSAILWGVAINGAASLLFPSGNHPQWLGAIGLVNSLIGLATMFLLLLIVFSFTGGGAGDVKLVGSIGSLLGLELGLEAVMYAFVVAGIVLGAYLVWTQGPLVFASTTLRRIGCLVLPGWVLPPEANRLQSLRKPVPLAPFFAVGAAVACSGLGKIFEPLWNA
jgi:prepilin signal peptidase PulO-like enzyme (type II secretory pathway)